MVFFFPNHAALTYFLGLFVKCLIEVFIKKIAYGACAKFN